MWYLVKDNKLQCWFIFLEKDSKSNAVEATGVLLDVNAFSF